jgi:hypothetical protein
METKKPTSNLPPRPEPRKPLGLAGRVALVALGFVAVALVGVATYTAADSFFDVKGAAVVNPDGSLTPIRDWDPETAVDPAPWPPGA